MSFTATHTHEGSWTTERTAADKAGRKTRSIKARILSRLSEEGDRGLTPDEFCAEVSGLINTIGRRFTDLLVDGKIRHHPGGATRTNDAGNECVVWVMGEDVGRKPSRVQALKDEIERLRELLDSAGVDPDQRQFAL